ncbi:MAG: YqgE/AlgH family protein [Gammaproteobacteria bacterium]|nr:YqgE/AlgH family protein [Gammaproteobacteria bacterium]MCP5458048.1 YqgE/AlgH family protein [Gammaproteobacteria bacterium]
METTYLNNHLLIAMPGLMDPNFHQTVTFLSEHNADGALGIVINRPLNITLGNLLEHLGIATNSPAVAGMPVYYGGPVQPQQGFVVHTPLGNWGSTLRVTDTVGITTSRDILEAVATGEGLEQALVALGYAGWGAGQLEREIAENSWLFGPSDQRILFDTPSEQRWVAAAALLGVDLNLLSGEAGHA